MLRLSAGLFLIAIVVVGCQCHLTDGLVNIPDAGHDPPDAGPPPPTFPLKVGDSLVYPVLGGRTDDTCAGHAQSGDCQRNITAQYDITAVTLDTATSRWNITANATYTGSQGDLISAATIAPLVLENVAPFATTTFDTPTQAAGAVFTTDAPATDELTANGFPFFQFDSGDAQVFETAGTAFCNRYTTLDAQANCRVQAADQKMEVFYKDDQAGGSSKIHKVHVDYMNMGFVCGWDEGLLPFVDGTPRDQNAFTPGVTPDVVAAFFPPKLKRDGADYQCSCFSQICSTGNGTDKKCLSTDPAVPASHDLCP